MAEETRFLDFWWENKKGKIFKGREDEPWNYGKEILIKKVFHLTRKENIEETKKVLGKPRRLSLPL